MLNRQELIELYRRRAKRYDLTANLYYLVGFREWSYRKKAVSALDLSPGDTVVEIGCGTGLNFDLLQQQVGSEGNQIGWGSRCSGLLGHFHPVCSTYC